MCVQSWTPAHDGTRFGVNGERHRRHIGDKLAVCQAGGRGFEPVHSANKIKGLQQVCCNPFFFVQTQGNSWGTLGQRFRQLT